MNKLCLFPAFPVFVCKVLLENINLYFYFILFFLSAQLTLHLLPKKSGILLLLYSTEKKFFCVFLKQDGTRKIQRNLLNGIFYVFYKSHRYILYLAFKVPKFSWYKDKNVNNFGSGQRKCRSGLRVLMIKGSDFSRS